MKRHTLPGLSTATQVGGGASTDSPIDTVFQFSKVVSSSISTDSTKALLYNISGIGSYDLEILENGQGLKVTQSGTDEEGETMQGAEVFGALGIVGRPLPPDKRGGRDEHMEVLCIRQQDGLVPIAARDLRLRMGGDGPGEGVIAFVGYGGGFHSLTPVAKNGNPDEGGSLHVIYCPFDLDSDGVAQKAHSIIMDPTEGNESVMMVHADGSAITMFEGSVTLKSPSGVSSISLDEDRVIIAAKKLVINATLYVGNEATSVPLLAGAASPPCSTAYFSP